MGWLLQSPPLRETVPRMAQGPYNPDWVLNEDEESYNSEAYLEVETFRLYLH